MKAIVRNVLLACIISGFAMFGALGRRPVATVDGTRTILKQSAAVQAESRKETLTCISVALLAWALCFWRCAAINRRLAAERMYKDRFTAYSRNNPYRQRLT